MLAWARAAAAPPSPDAGSRVVVRPCPVSTHTRAPAGWSVPAVALTGADGTARVSLSKTTRLVAGAATRGLGVRDVRSLILSDRHLGAENDVRREVPPGRLVVDPTKSVP